jgi:4-hydroxy-tetrahydrodipicolinate synthase
MAGTKDYKAWAKENVKGLENVIIPSFNADFSDIDEEGIRWDVQQSIKHGFFSSLCSAEVGLC